jgi:uncharacterized repeat protein (TIGR03803 family)
MLPNGTLTTFYAFNSTNSFYPDGALVQGTDGSFYGTTNGGYGSAFKITSEGTLTTLYLFGDVYNGGPIGPLIQGTDGNFYGVNYRDGANGTGSVFRITPTGAVTTLYSFDWTNTSPVGGLLQDTNGSLYGTTYHGGTGADCPAEDGGCGTVYGLAVGLKPFVEKRFLLEAKRERQSGY